MKIIKLKFRKDANKKFFVTLTCSDRLWEIEGYLQSMPSALVIALKQWQSIYRNLDVIRTQPITRITPKSVTVSSSVECINNIKKHLNQWLNSTAAEWQSIRDGLISVAQQFPNEELPIIIDARDINLCRIPWQEWELLVQYYPNTEIAISTPTTKDIVVNDGSNKIVRQTQRILLIVGRSDGIDTELDLNNVRELTNKKAEIVCLIQPSLAELSTALWCDRGFDILIFTGHSGSDSKGTIGWIEINEKEKLTIEEFKAALRQAIDKGLQLAIFNSCDGLGLADRLLELNLAQIIVMSEPVPDEVAIAFMSYFFQEFIDRNSLFSSVCKARQKLEPFNNRYPGAVWLPTLCLKPAANYLTWQETKERKTISRIINAEPIKTKNKFIQPLLSIFLCCLTFILGFSIDVIYPQLKVNLINNNSKLEFPAGTWQYGGSTTWQSIRDLADKKIQEQYPHFKLIYTRHPTLPNGSGTGIRMLLNGQISFAQSSRPVEDREYDSAIIRGKILKQVPVAIDGVAIVVNPSLEIDGLTIKDLAEIYTGKITDWSLLGGQELPITPYTRPLQSGTTEFFRANILKGNTFSKNVVFLDYPTLALKQIEENPGGIFFVSISEVINNCQLKILPIARRSGSDYISLDRDSHSCGLSDEHLNVSALLNGSYPLVRRLFVIIETNSPVDEEVGEAYKNFLLTQQGQELIAKSGFIPIRSF